jgi:hypothetical protein
MHLVLGWKCLIGFILEFPDILRPGYNIYGTMHKGFNLGTVPANVDGWQAYL